METLKEKAEREELINLLVGLLGNALSTLTPQEVRALRYLYGADTEPSQKRLVKDAADLMGMSTTRFGQVREKARFKLRKSRFALLFADLWV